MLKGEDAGTALEIVDLQTFFIRKNRMTADVFYVATFNQLPESVGQLRHHLLFPLPESRRVHGKPIEPEPPLCGALRLAHDAGGMQQRL